MNKNETLPHKQYGLVGRHISYSFSPSYFAKKFELLGIEAQYSLFDIEYITQVDKVLAIDNLKGLNVTIPYKQEIIPYLDSLSTAAKSINAVNTILFKDGKKIGHNTDYMGFINSIKPLLQSHHQKALILGTGGANKAVQYALKQLGIAYKVVSRSKSKADYTYADLDQETVQNYQIIINTTPVGTYPAIEKMPEVPVEFINKNHLVYDLIYNPAQTKLLKAAKQQGAVVKNGLQMLEEQADASWNIWNA